MPRALHVCVCARTRTLYPFCVRPAEVYLDFEKLAHKYADYMSFWQGLQAMWDRDILQFFLIGIVLFGLGLLGEYIGRIYEQVRGRPRYLIDAVLEQRSEQRTFESSVRIKV